MKFIEGVRNGVVNLHEGAFDGYIKAQELISNPETGTFQQLELQRGQEPRGTVLGLLTILRLAVDPDFRSFMRGPKK